jgi:uncharacterized membrane protein (DUF373 family)
MPEDDRRPPEDEPKRPKEAEQAAQKDDAAEGEATSVAEAVAEEEGTPGTHEQQRALGRLEPIFDGLTLVLYIAVGALLAALAVLALGYTLYSIPEQLGKGVPHAISGLLSELLLVLILVEIIRTIVTFITTRTSSIRPFLTVAIISSVRRILSVGAELSLVEDMPREAFNRAMLELAAEGGLILVIALALFLVSRREGG